MSTHIGSGRDELVTVSIPDEIYGLLLVLASKYDLTPDMMVACMVTSFYLRDEDRTEQKRDSQSFHNWAEEYFPLKKGAKRN